MDYTSGGPFGILKNVAQWGHTSGPAQFMLRTLIAGTSTAVLTGLFGAFSASLIWETAALPFVISASLGFLLGSLSWYRTAVERAILSLERYPALLRLHLDYAFPNHHYRTQPLQYFVRRNFDQHWAQKSRLLVAWLGARDSLDTIMTEREKRIVESEIEGAAAVAKETIPDEQ